MTFDATESEVESFKNNISSIRESALTRVLQTSEGLKYASSLSAQEVGKEGHSYISEAMSRETISQAQEMDMMTGYILDRSRRTHGSSGENALQATISDINALLRDGADGQKILDQDILGFLRNRFDGMDTNSVIGDINRSKVAIKEGIAPLRQAAIAAAAEAEAQTSDNRFSEPRPILAKPTDIVKEKQEARRGANEQVYENTGAFDHTTNPFERVGREIVRPMVPQPDVPDARTLVGRPGKLPDSAFKGTAEKVNTPPPKGFSTLAGDYSEPNWGKELEGDQEAFRRLEGMLEKVDRR